MKKLNISKNDYKNFIEIEIELIPEEYSSGQFINILNKKDELYYHIYLNDDKKELKRNYITKEDKAIIIRIIIDHNINSFSKLFENCGCIESVNIIKSNISNIKNANRMFF